MFGLVKISRLGRQIQPQFSVLLRYSSHFTYVPDAPVQDMGKFFVWNIYYNPVSIYHSWKLEHIVREIQIRLQVRLKKWPFYKLSPMQWTYLSQQTQPP